MRKWRIEDSEELYNINGWGASYFRVNDKGNMVATPRKDGVEIDLRELMDELALRDVEAPVLLRLLILLPRGLFSSLPLPLSLCFSLFLPLNEFCEQNLFR